MRRKFLSVVLCVCMMLTMAPFAFATGDTESSSGSGGGGSTKNVAQIGEVKYTSLNTAFSDVKDNETITLLSDVAENTNIANGKTFTIDLNGNTWSVTSMIKITNSSSLTVMDSTATALPIVSSDYSSVEYSSGRIVNTLNTRAGGTTIDVDNTSSFTLNSGTLESKKNYTIQLEGKATINGGYQIGQEGGLGVWDNAVLTVNNGVIVGIDNSAVAGNGTEGRGGTTVNINGGTLIGHIVSNGYTANAIYHPNSGTLNIAGGTIYADGGVGVLARAGNINITGGKIIATHTKEGWIGDSKVALEDGYGVYYDLKSDYPGHTSTDKVTISDNAYISGETGAVGLLNKDGDSSNPFEVTGGTFSSNVASYVNTPYSSIKQADGTYKVAQLTKENAIAQIENSETLYPSIAAALSAASPGETVKVLQDTSIDSYTPVNQNVTIDLNGNTIYSKGAGFDVAVNTANAELTLKNGTMKVVAYAAWVQNGGKVTIESDMTVESTKYAAIVVVDNVSSVVVNGTVKSEENFAISGNGGKNHSGTSITINNGAVVESADAPAIYHPQSGTLTVNGGFITGTESAIAIKSGTLNISGGTIKATGLDTTPTEGYSNGINASGAAIQIESNVGYYGNPDNTYNSPHNDSDEVQINITGGNIESQNGVAIYEYLDSKTSKSSVKGINISSGYIKGPKANFMVSEQLSNDKISVTGGYFTSDPTTYVKSTAKAPRYVVDSDVTGYSFKVTPDVPQKAPVIVADKTEVTNAIADNDAKNAVDAIINNANVDGVAEAITDTAKNTVLAKAGVNENDQKNPDVRIIIDVSVAVKALDATTDSESKITSLTFEAVPAATVTTVTNNVASPPSQPIDIPNSYLNGNITVKLPLPEGFTPKQIKHISADNSVEYFLDHSERGAKTFTIDDNHCAVFTITKFSTFEVSGMQTYVEPSSGGPGSSGGSISAPTTYAVNVNAATNGAVAADKKTASKGTTVTVTASPSKGYVVDAVKVVDKDGKDVAVTGKDGKYVFTMPGSAVTVTGTFKAETPVSLPFTDVKSGDWFYPAVQYAYAQGLMTGTSATTFAPNGTMNRAMIVTVLYRLEKSPAVTGASKFTDVPAGQWYSDAVAWAAANKIVNGYDETTFGPMNAVTREQMAAILFRYEQVKGLENVTLEENLNRFPDQNKISAYAIPALQWAVGQKIINGNADGTLDPTGTATRAQVAQIFTNLLNK